MPYQRVTSNVYLVGSGELSGPGDCMVYTIKLDDDSGCLIDAGTSNGRDIVGNMKEVGIEGTSHMIITHAHYDHAGAAHQVKKTCPGMRIHAHELDVDAIEGKPGTSGITAASWYSAKYRPVNVDNVLQGNKGVLDLQGTVVKWYHAPGHTRGSIVAVFDDDGQKIMFGQDIHGPFMAEFKSDKDEWARSMALLLELECDILCEGHYGIYRGKEEVRGFIEGQLRAHGKEVR